jgi:hypothetical protein
MRTLPPLRFPVIADAAFPCKYGTLVAELQRISSELSLTLNLMRNFKPLFRHSQVENPRSGHFDHLCIIFGLLHCRRC